MRVLFYGGCHAVALERLSKGLAAGRHSFDSLQNYELINAGTPFPYERLGGYDAVVYSPIRNKDQWNTEHLVERCRALGITTVCYPWLQWNGYFPDVMKVERPPHVWGYRRLADLAGAGATLPQLLAEANSREALDPLGYADWSFKALEEHEAGVDIPVSGFIRERFRAERLFWTPDHPTLALYTYVHRQIMRRLGIGLKWFARRTEEIHPDEFIILPGVREALGLEFAAGEYRPAEWQRGAGLGPFLSVTLELFGPKPAADAS